MDLLQMLILLTITGICGATAIVVTGFSPRGVMILLVSLISGTIGAAVGTVLGGWSKAWAGIPVLGWLFIPLALLYDVFLVKIGTLRLSITFTLLGSVIVIGILMGLQLILVRTDRRVSKVKESDGISS